MKYTKAFSLMVKSDLNTTLKSIAYVLRFEYEVHESVFFDVEE